MASGGSGTHTSGTLHHTEKRNLHGYKTILDMASDSFLDHVLGWNVESLTCFITTYEGLCTSYACGALWGWSFWKIFAPAGRNFYREGVQLQTQIRAPPVASKIILSKMERCINFAFPSNRVCQHITFWSLWLHLYFIISLRNLNYCLFCCFL